MSPVFYLVFLTFTPIHGVVSMDAWKLPYTFSSKKECEQHIMAMKGLQSKEKVYFACIEVE